MKKFIVAGAAFFVLLVAIVWINSSDTSNKPGIASSQAQPTEDALGVTLDFYNEWLTALQSTTTNPYELGLTSLPIISPEVKAAIEADQEEIYPVICQATVPERVGGKTVYANATEAQVMVFARGGVEKSPFQSIVTLTAVAGKWQISSINCAQGEVAPEREFDFAKTGFLLKSVPPPLDPQYWHLVYEENGIEGHTIPLFFTSESMCVALDGTESICNEAQFVDATKVSVRADVAEAGATVRSVTFE